jgi:hypothetical protein
LFKSDGYLLGSYRIATVRDHDTMIAAPVQRDVDGIPKGSHFFAELKTRRDSTRSRGPVIQALRCGQISGGQAQLGQVPFAAGEVGVPLSESLPPQRRSGSAAAKSPRL